MAVSAPFDMDEPLDASAPGSQALLVLVVVASVPTCPNRRRVDIGNIRRKVAAAKRCQPGTVEPMRKIAHLSHESAYFLLIEGRILIGPIVLIAQAPKNDRGVVVMLIDHVGKHGFRVLLQCLVADAGAAPWRLFPNHQAQLVAQVEHQPILLVVREPDEVCAHLADHPHLFAHQVVAHRGSHACVVRVTMRSAQQYTLAVQLKRPVLEEFDLAYAKALVQMRLSGGTGERNPAAIEARGFRRPELRRWDAKFGKLRKIVPGGDCPGRPMNGVVQRIPDLN